jgi:hypothetical protein
MIVPLQHLLLIGNRKGRFVWQGVTTANYGFRNLLLVDLDVN